MEPIERVVEESIKQKIILAAILLMYGILGIVAVVIVQNYLSTRASLSRVRAFSDTLVENLPIGLVVIGDNGRIITVNDVSLKLLDLPVTGCPGMQAREILPGPIIELIAEVDDAHPVVARDVSMNATGRKIA
ncbi:MAG TPA: hypothetical protein PLW83_10220, partial [Deltaproteobacteria bacterium]|nr:hypothetical protein [Deltaproteobacteria bacterium]